MSSWRFRSSSGLSGAKLASPTTLSTHADDDTFSVGSDPTTHDSIALSRQDSEYSFVSEYTEDTFAFTSMVESFKAEITGDYSHFERKKYASPDDDETSFTQFSQHLEESSGNSSFPRDDASPTIHVVLTPGTSKTRYSESPSREMRRLIYSASKTKAPNPDQAPNTKTPPPPQSLSFRSRTAPARSTFASSPIYHSNASNDSRGRVASRDFAHHQTWVSHKENVQYESDKSIAELMNSRSRMRRPDTPDEPLKQTTRWVHPDPAVECDDARSDLPTQTLTPSTSTASPNMMNALKQASPSVRRRDPSLASDNTKPDFPTVTLTPCKSTARPKEMKKNLSPQQPQQSDCGFGDMPFDEIDFFDWYSLNVKPKERSQYDSPLLDVTQTPFDESPKRTLLSNISSPKEDPTTRNRLTMTERVEARFSREAPKNTRCPIIVDSTQIPELSPQERTPFTSLLSKFDRVDTSSFASSTARRGLTRSLSYREKIDSLSHRNLKNTRMQRSESFTFGSDKRADLSSAPQDAADVLSPTLSLENTNTEKQGQDTSTITKSSANEDLPREQQTEFPFSTPTKPTLTSEGIEVALSDPNFSVELSARPGLSRSQSWKEKCGTRSRPSLMRKSASFTLGSKRRSRTRENPIRFSTLKTMPSINEGMPDHVNKAIVPLSTSEEHKKPLSKAPPSAKTSRSSEPPKSRGLSRSQSLRSKLGLHSRPTLMKRSESFTFGTKHYGKVVEPVHSESVIASTSAEEIEVTLRTPATRQNRVSGHEKKKNTETTKAQGLNSSPATVLDFPEALLELLPEDEYSAKSNECHDTPAANGLGKKLGKTICRVGNRVSCRSTARDSESFDPFASSPREEIIKPSADTGDASAEISQSYNNHKGAVERKKAAASQNNVGSSRTLDTFDDRLDDLLEKVGLGSLVLSPPPPAVEQGNEASPAILDTVINFHI